MYDSANPGGDNPSETSVPIPRIVEKPELRVIGFEDPFISVMSPDATNFAVIGPLWDRLVKSVAGISGRIGNEMFGVIYGRPAAERSHPHEMQYLAGVAVSSSAVIPDGMVARTIPAGTFAVFTHRGPIKEIGTTISEIYRDWLPRSPYRHAEIADVELYDRRFRMNDDSSEMEYWISVTPR